MKNNAGQIPNSERSLTRRACTVLLFALPICVLLSLFAGSVIKEHSYRERALGMTAALDKEKSFDLKPHSFALMLTVRVQQKDLFRFNEQVPALRNLFYTFVTEKRGKLIAANDQELATEFSSHLTKAKIDARDLGIKIESRAEVIR